MCWMTSESYNYNNLGFLLKGHISWSFWLALQATACVGWLLILSSLLAHSQEEVLFLAVIRRRFMRHLVQGFHFSSVEWHPRPIRHPTLRMLLTLFPTINIYCIFKTFLKTLWRFDIKIVERLYLCCIMLFKWINSQEYKTFERCPEIFLPSRFMYTAPSSDLFFFFFSPAEDYCGHSLLTPNLPF